MTSQISYPKISYHGGHSSDLCVHAPPPDTKDDLIKSYAAAGFTHLGIVEHLQAPDDRFLFPEEIAAGFSAQALSERLNRFFSEVRPRLETEYGESLNLAIGFETEYYSADPNTWLLQMFEAYRPDYIVASVHHVRDIPIDFSAERFNQAALLCGGVEQLAVEYFRAIRALIIFLKENVSVPVVVGHLDLVKLFAPHGWLSSKVEDELRTVVAAGTAAGFLFEVNARAFKKGLSEPYPGPPILKLIKEYGGLITFGDDAHAANEVGMNLDLAAKAAGEYFKEITAFERRDGKLIQLALPLG